MNHPAVTKAAANITQLAHVSWPSGTVPNMTTIAEIIERETKYSRLVAELEKRVWKFRTQFPDDPYCEICGVGQDWAKKHGHEKDCVLAEINDLGNGPRR